MKWGVALNVSEPVKQTVEHAILLEKAGIDQLWISDFPADRYAPAVAAAVAQGTSACTIGVGLISPYLYDVKHIAQSIATLAERYGPRFMLLMGPGDRFALGRVGVTLPSGSVVVKRMERAASEVKHLLEDAGVNCPILLGAQGPKMMEASKSTDGVLLNYADLKMADWAMGHFKEAPDDFIMGLFPPTYLSPDAEPGHKAIRYASAMVALGLARSLQDEFCLREEIAPVSDSLAEKGRITTEMVNQLSTNTLSKFGLAMNGEQLCDFMHEAMRRGFDLVVLGPPLCMDPDAIRYLAQTRGICRG